MIKFSNGHSFEFMTASGALAFDGRGWPWEWPLRWVGLLDPKLFTIVTKTLTRHPRKGNLRWSHPWSVVKRIPPSPLAGEEPALSLSKEPALSLSKGRGEGVVNAIGLTNKGIEWWLKEITPKIQASYKMIVSIEADDVQDTCDMIRMLAGQKILGVELNLSCPNTGAAEGRTTEKMLEICQKASEISTFPLIAKISYAHDYLSIAKAFGDMKIEAIAINSVPWSVIFPHHPSPLIRFGGGGVSGKTIQSYTWKMVEEISKSSKIPVIGPSVWDYEDIQKIFDRGATAVSFGSVFVRYPWRPTRFVRRWVH